MVAAGGRRDRFIPACAGNTGRPELYTGQPSVHPRVCGEHFARRRHILSDAGSSPRVRGTRVLDRRRCGGSRFIPACAGNTRKPLLLLIIVAVHPRVCGEHLMTELRSSMKPGSSPRVRGTLLKIITASAVARFIPACAGNTRKPLLLLIIVAVHPRVCGEHLRRAERKRPAAGSSPRVRGTQDRFWRDVAGNRFIPACAGNTVPANNLSGETPGSSPRVRGTPDDGVEEFNEARFIPACAGNTP